MKVASWNVNSLKTRLAFVMAWLERESPEILLLQETKLRQDDFPSLEFESLGYRSEHFGLSQWNGVAVLSRGEFEGLDLSLNTEIEFNGSPEARFLSVETLGLRVVSVYVPNGRAVEDPHFRYKLEWLERLRGKAEEYLRSGGVVIGGDFNVAPTAQDVWDEERLQGSTHITAEERAGIEGLMASGLTDTFRYFHPEGGTYSWWDYRGGAFHKGEGMRIDLLLASEDVVARATDSTIDRQARKTAASGEKPSDHAPVVLTLR